MKKTLKEYRLYQHLSQQQLAEQSGVSLRTIQRIESGASAGSPYIIRQLSAALNIDSLNLIPVNAAPEPESNTEKLPESGSITEYVYNRRVKYINFSALTACCFPFLNLVIPVALYFLFRKSLTDSRNKTAVKKILSLQILWSVAALIMLIAIPLIDYYLLKVGEVLEIPLFVWSYLLLVIVLMLITLKTASDINRKQDLLTFVPDIL
ncbi:helix-turn-helix domain-containing protein [Gynurincola endophyticus]|uniref:helix-turn-helix domain-containing protein n=1 Tax=Gynurincola endophyticus TaxID=2479004 RepID=UPI0013153C1E|nr:helix-turn-helix domain-containing protein [Gynurincola endophyticus]